MSRNIFSFPGHFYSSQCSSNPCKYYSLERYVNSFIFKEESLFMAIVVSG